MAKFLCRCGERMNLSFDWERYEYRIVKEEVIKLVGALLDENDRMCSLDFHDKLNEHAGDVLMCPECNRFYVNWGGRFFTPYIKEGTAPSSIPDYQCSCGVSLAHPDGDHTCVLMKDSAMEGISDILDDKLPLPSDLFYRLTADVTNPVLICPECGRHHIKMKEGVSLVYAKEVAVPDEDDTPAA